MHPRLQQLCTLIYRICVLLFTDNEHSYLPKLCIAIYRSCVLLFTERCARLIANLCALLIADHNNIFRRYYTIVLIQLLISLLSIFPVVAQTADTVVVDTTLRPANTIAKMSPLKKLVSDVAGILMQQQQYYTLSFDTSKSVRCRIEKSAPLYTLPGGESRAVLFMLPVYTDEYMLTIRSMVHGFGFTWHIFAPTVVFLDSLFKPTRLLPEKQFSLINPRGLLKALSLRADVRMNSEYNTDKYLLIFTMKSGKRLDTYSDASTLAPFMLNHPVEGSPDGRLELELRRN